MKAVKILLLFLIVSIALAGCTEKAAKRPEDVQKLLMKMKSYQCDVIMAVNNYKSTNVYKAKQMFQYPDKYRIEIVEPAELMGQTTIYNHEKAYIYHPQLKTYLLTENFNTSEQYSSFIGSFIEAFKDNGGAKFTMEELQGKQCFVLEIPIKDGSLYRDREKVWIDAQSIVPVKAEIMDKNNQVNVQVLYENFVINPKLEDELFRIPEGQ